MSLTSEDELIRRAQAGDLDAFGQLARAYERRIYSLALYFCQRREDAEDLSQEVWLKAFKSLGSFRGESSFYTWLRRITVNSFITDRRAMMTTNGSEKTSVRLDNLEHLAEGTGHSPAHGRGEAESGFHRQILVGRVMQSLGELTPQQRLTFLLKHREGMSYREIAGMFGCSIGSVQKSLFRSVEKLRASLGLGEEVEERAHLRAGGKS